MIKIGICDDEITVLGALKYLIQECLEELGEEADIFEFRSGDQVLTEFHSLDLIFLDIEMPGLDGIEIGKALHRMGYQGKLIMATGFVDRFKEAFVIEAFRFVTKPFQKDEILGVLEDFIRARLGIKQIQVYKDRNIYTFLQKDIIAVKAMNSAVELEMKNGIFRKESSLAEMEQVLDSRLFFRISKQYIINMQEISKYRNGKLMLHGTEYKVSVRKKKEFERTYMMFDAEYR